MIRWLILSIAVFSAAVLAAEEPSKPTGRIFAPGPVTVSRVTLPPEAGVAPLVAGDEIVTGSFPAVLMLSGRNRVSLDKDSRARVEDLGDGMIAVRLFEGRLTYELQENSKVVVFEGNTSVSSDENRRGTAQQGPQEGRPTGFMPPNARPAFPGTVPPAAPPSPSAPPQE